MPTPLATPASLARDDGEAREPPCTHDATIAAISRRRPGTELSCRSWATEAAMRMLMNNLDPERRRGARGAGRLWRHRPRGARLGELRQDRRDAAAARGRRDPAGPVGQAGRRVPHPCGRAARADRQFEPGAEMGDLGPFQRIGSQGPDDVRPDDGRIVDLYRHPGHRPGHLRDLRRDGPPAL